PAEGPPVRAAADRDPDLRLPAGLGVVARRAGREVLRAPPADVRGAGGVARPQRGPPGVAEGLPGGLPVLQAAAPLAEPRAAHAVTDSAPENLAHHDYFVLIGHSKGEHDYAAIADNFRQLNADGRFEFVTLSELALQAREELNGRPGRGPREEADHRVAREDP